VTDLDWRGDRRNAGSSKAEVVQVAYTTHCDYQPQLCHAIGQRLLDTSAKIRARAAVLLKINCGSAATLLGSAPISTRFADPFSTSCTLVSNRHGAVHAAC
jgi:hypothetical protein